MKKKEKSLRRFSSSGPLAGNARIVRTWSHSGPEWNRTATGEIYIHNRRYEIQIESFVPPGPAVSELSTNFSLERKRRGKYAAYTSRPAFSPSRTSNIWNTWGTSCPGNYRTLFLCNVISLNRFDTIFHRRPLRFYKNKIMISRLKFNFLTWFLEIFLEKLQ